jgi:hypothetical protein
MILTLPVCLSRLCAADPNPQSLVDAFHAARGRYESDGRKLPAETARSRYVIALTEIAYRYLAIDKGKACDALQAGWDALNQEIALHPAPENSDSAKFSRLLVGKWSSPRHDYEYLADGRWRMIPYEPGVTAGHWRIRGNQYLDGDIVEDGAATHGIPYTIILLNKRYFVFMDARNGVYFEHRISK